MKTQLRYEGMIDVLAARVPAFATSDWGREMLAAQRDLPYVVFGSFASFLNGLLSAHRLLDATVEASFQLLNEMGSAADQRVIDLASAGVFEVLTDSPQSIRVARELLYGRALDLFEQMVQVWGAEAGDP